MTYLGFDDLNALIYKCKDCGFTIGVLADCNKTLNEIHATLIGDTCPNCNKIIERIETQ